MEAASPPLFSAATAEALEVPSFLALLGAMAATDLGKGRLLTLTPKTERADLETARRRYDEAARLVAERRLVASFDFPVAELLDAIGGDRIAAIGPALVRLADLLKATAEARDRLLAGGQPAEGFPELGRLARELPDLGELAARIGKTLDRRGQVREDASPKLAKLRERIRRVRDGLYGELKRHLEADAEHLTEETIPMRGGRLVLVLSAGARGRVPGLVHGRSATGKSFYFEPLSVVEANNDLQQATEDEEAERQRILNELLTLARRSLPDLRAHAAFLGELDALQAAVRFAGMVGGELPEVAPRGELRLIAARHPLLDPTLAELRAEVLGAGGRAFEVVPLELELTPERRLLVVTGPNAGGKTVVLKTVGLLAVIAQCGLPIPAALGSRLPFLTGMVATVGDEQDLLADRSTFSGRLLRLKEAWEAAGPDSLVLLDELGSGTDPEEGSALSVALLESLAEKGTLGLISTHLAPVAAAALEQPGAGCGAMQFDPATGKPTYRLLPGPPGGSEALSLARRLGLPAAWLDRAEGRLGTAHRDLRRLLAELERVRSELSAETLRLERERFAGELARAQLTREREALEAERKAVGRKLAGELEAFRTETRRRLRDEVERLRAELEGGRRKNLAPEAEARLFADAPVLGVEEPLAEAPLVVGAAVRHRGLGWEGVLEKLHDGKAEVQVRGKRLRVAAEELQGKAPAGPSPPRRERIAVTRAEPRGDAEEAAPTELHLIGKRVEPALEELDAYLDGALLAGAREVRIVHGHGTGRLRDAIRQHLKGHPAVASARPGEPNEGGNGATVAALRRTP